jgi:putative antirepressor protein|nr:MAG TPA: KilAC domain protein [Caudoviricetes sp.]
MENELINLSGANNSNSLKMSSREIAELIGKRHHHVMRDIRNMEPAWEKVNGTKFGLVEYIDGKGEKRPEYQLDKREVLYVATKWNDEIRAKIILRWEELENNLRNNQNVISLPQNYEEALEHLLIQVRENKKLIAENKVLQPKADFYDAVAQSEDTIDVGQVAKVLAIKGYGRNNMFKFLREQNVLMHNNQPYQKYIDNGCFKQIETQWYDRKAEMTHIGLKTVVYQKGLDFIRNLINSHNG